MSNATKGGLFIFLFMIVTCWLTFNLARRSKAAEEELVKGSTYHLICAYHSRTLGEMVTDQLGSDCRLRGDVIVRSEYLEGQIVGALYCQTVICPPK